jgi:hypothetical protein
VYEAFESESERERVAVVKYLLALVLLLPVLYTAAASPPAAATAAAIPAVEGVHQLRY